MIGQLVKFGNEALWSRTRRNLACSAYMKCHISCTLHVFTYMPLASPMQGTHPRDHRGGLCIAALEVRIFFGMTHNAPQLDAVHVVQLLSTFLLRMIKIIIIIIREKKNRKLSKIVQNLDSSTRDSLFGRPRTNASATHNIEPTSNTAIQRRLRRSGLYCARRPRLASFGNLEYSRTSSAARYG
jgi:hypothetical protein